MKEDNTLISGVPLSLMFDVLTGDSAAKDKALPDVMKKIKAWAGKRFFIVTPPATSMPLLYTLGSTQVMHWIGDDVCCKRLVMVIPKFAAVTTTSLQPAVAEAKVDGLEWASDDLRHQLLLMHHECQLHAKPSAMLRQLEERAWWPSIWVDINKHFDACSVCTPLTAITRRPGMSIIMSQRFHTVVVDHWIIPADIQAACGVTAILTMADMSGTMVTAKRVVPSRRLSLCSPHGSHTSAARSAYAWTLGPG